MSEAPGDSAGAGKETSGGGDQLEVLRWAPPTSEESSQKFFNIINQVKQSSPSLDGWDAKLVGLMEEQAIAVDALKRLAACERQAEKEAVAAAASKSQGPDARQDAPHGVDMSNFITTKCREEGRRLRGDGGWKVGDSLSDSLRTVVSVDFGDSGDSDQYLGLLPSDRLGSSFSYSDLRNSGVTIKHDRREAIIRGPGTEVKSRGSEWRLKGHTITMVYEPKERKLCFWTGGADSITGEPDTIITGLAECRMSAAVGLYSNSASVVTFEEHSPGPELEPQDETVGRKSASALQMEFFLSSLELLLLADKDSATASGVSALMMSHIERFVSDLPPVSLFEPVDKALNKTMDVLCDYLVKQATTTNASGAALLLVQLTLARGSLAAVVRLASALAEHPQLLTVEVVNSLAKISDVEAYSSRKKSLFYPRPGSLAFFAAVWKREVMPALRKVDDSADIAKQVMSEVEKGDGETAEALIRALLPEKMFATLCIPNLHQIENSKRRREFEEAVAIHEQVVEHVNGQNVTGGTVNEADIVALVLSHVDLAACHLDENREQQVEHLRVPMCVDADALVPLMDILQKYCTEDLLVKSELHRKLCDVVLRLLTLNFDQSALVACHKLPSDCSIKLQTVLIDIIGMDFVAHPQCSKLGSAAVRTFASGRALLLQTTDAKLEALSILATKLLALPKTKTSVKEERESVSKFPTAEDKMLVPLPLRTRSTQIGPTQHVGAVSDLGTSVSDVRGAISKIIDELGNVLRTWPEAGWEGGDQFRSTVEANLTAGPTAQNPCVLAQGLSDDHAERLVSGLQSTTLESVNGLQAEKNGDRVIVYLRGTKVDPSAEMLASFSDDCSSLATNVLSVPADGELRSKCDIAMPSGGLYYLEVSLTDRSAEPSDDIPQGFGFHTRIGVCSTSFNFNENQDANEQHSANHQGIASVGSDDKKSMPASTDLVNDKTSTCLFAPVLGRIVTSNDRDTDATKTKCREEGRRLRGDGGWKVGDSLSDSLRTVVSVDFGDSGDSDQYLGLLPSDRLGSSFSYSDLRNSGVTIKHGRREAIIRGPGTEVKSRGSEWRLKGHTITMVYEPKERKLCFWTGGADSITGEPDTIITGLAECRMSAAVGLYSNSASVVTFEEHQPAMAGHEPEWFGSDGWWQSTNSVCAGDRAGLLLDTAKGDLIAMKNGKPLGVLVSGLPDDEWHWYFEARDPGVQLQAFGAFVATIDDVACLCRPSSPTEQSLSARRMIEEMMATTLTEVAKPSSLNSFLFERRSIRALDHVLKILAHNAFTNEDSTGSTALPVALLRSTMVHAMRLLSEEPDPETIPTRSTVADIAQLLSASSVPESSGPDRVLALKRAVAVTRARAEHISRAVALIDCVGKFTREVFAAIRKPELEYSPFYVLEKSQLEPLMNAAQALGLTIAKKRTADGQIAAVALADILALTLKEMQQTVDARPDLMANPQHPVVLAAAEMAAVQNCDFRTAAYYVYSFGGPDAVDMEQAVAEYKASGKKAAPAGYSIPVAKHWLVDAAFTMNHCFARCIETLFAGLKCAEGDFDITLFDKKCDKQAAATMMENVDIAAVRQPWVGYPSPVLAQVETIAIQAMIAHCGLLAEDMSSLDVQGTLLHIGKQALKIKRTVQDLYRASSGAASWEDVGAGAIDRARLLLNYAGAAAPSNRVTVDLSTEDSVFLWERENASSHVLCLHTDKLRRFIQSHVSESRVIDVLEARAKAVSEAGTGYNAAVTLLEEGRPSILASKRPTAQDGGATNMALYTTLSGSWTLSATSQRHPNIRMQINYELQCADEFIFGSGTLEESALLAELFLKFDRDLDGKLNKHEYRKYLDAVGCWGHSPFTDSDFDFHGWPMECTTLQCNPLEGGGISWESFRDVLYGQFRQDRLAADLKMTSIQTKVSVFGRVCDFGTDGTIAVEWTETCANKVSKRVEVQVNYKSGDDITLSGTGNRQGAKTEFTLAGKLKKPGLNGTDQALRNIFAQDDSQDQAADDTSSSDKNLSLLASGICVAQQHYRFLLSAASSFGELGQLSEQSAQASSESLTEVVISLFYLDPSEAIRTAAGRLLLMRLDNDGSRYLARSAAVRQIVLQASRKCRGTSTSLHTLQGKFVAALLLKLADVSNSADDDLLLGEYVGAVLDALRAGDGLQDVRWMNAIRAACFSPGVMAKLHVPANNDYLWAAVEGKKPEPEESVEHINAARLASLHLLMLVIKADTTNLNRMLRLILASSPEVGETSAGAKLAVGERDTKTSCVAVRVNASLALRNLVCTDSEWSKLFCLSCNEAASLTSLSLDGIRFGNDVSIQSIPVFPHLQVMGVIEIQGSSQPGDASHGDGITTVFDACIDTLRELLEHVLLKASPKQASSLAFHILQSRLLKVAFELSSHQTSRTSGTTMLTARCIAAVAKLAAESTEPTCIELILDKIHCVYPLANTPDAVKMSQMSPTMKQNGEVPSKQAEANAQSGDTSNFPTQPLATIDIPRDDLLTPLKPSKMAKAVASETNSFLSSGSIVAAAIEAERALTIMLARLCVISALADETLAKPLSAVQVGAVLGKVFVGGDEVIRPQFQTHPTLQLTSVEQAITAFCADPAKLTDLMKLCVVQVHGHVQQIVSEKDEAICGKENTGAAVVPSGWSKEEWIKWRKQSMQKVIDDLRSGRPAARTGSTEGYQ